MKMIRRLTVLTAVLVLAASCCLAETKLVDTVKSGKLSRQTWTDENGNTVNGPDGYAYTVFTYSKGQVTERYFTADDQPFRMTGGYYGRIISRGMKNRIEEIVYLDENGKQAMTDSGYARVTMAYTSKGDLTRLNYFNAANKPTVNTDLGYATLENEYRGRTLTRSAFLDENRRPVDAAAGYAEKTVSVTKKNNIRGITYKHANGKPATCEEGWSSCDITLDKKERETARKYYDENGNLIAGADGVAWEEKKYEKDNIYTVTAYDLNGAPVVRPQGCTGLRLELDKEERIVRESYLDAAGNPVRNADGAGATRFGYDSDGRLTQVIYEDLDGNVALNGQGIAGYTDTLDANGFLVSRVYLGENGAAKECLEGWSEIRYTRAADGTLTQTAYYRVDGTQVK